MSATPSNMLELGTTLPSFSLPDTVSGNTVSSDESVGENGIMVMFICNHCPYVKHIYDAFGPLADEYQKKGIAFIAVSSNDVEQYPEDGPEPMKQLAREKNWSFPYLYDETQQAAKAFQAACTPDLFLFDSEKKLAYRGQFDGSRPANETPVTGSDLRAAMDFVIAGKPVPEPQVPSIGCNIKWKI